MAWEQLVAAGIQAAGAIGATAASQGMTKQARKENFEYNEKSADAALIRQKNLQDYLMKLQYRQFYDLESPSAIMQQLKNAGLSPSIYAQNAVGGNVSGVTTAPAPQGAGASGLAAPMVQNPLELSGTYLQMAQAKKANAEAETILGENERGQAEIEKLVEEKLGIQAKTAYLKLQKDLAEIQLYIADETKEFDIAEAMYNSEQAFHQSNYVMYHARKEKALAEIETQTIKEKVESEYLKNANLRTQKQLMHAQIGLTDAEANKCASEIEKWREELLQQWCQININDKQVTSYGESIKIDKTFKEDSIKSLYARLQTDKDIANQINNTRLKELTETWVNDILSNIVDVVCSTLK